MPRRWPLSLSYALVALTAALAGAGHLPGLAVAPLCAASMFLARLGLGGGGDVPRAGRSRIEGGGVEDVCTR